MKLSTLLILLPFASVALGRRSPRRTKCRTDYCAALGNETTQCANDHQNMSSNGYLSCVCSETNREIYDNCRECTTGQSLKLQYTNEWNNTCAVGSAASSDKTYSWTTFVLVVVGGVIAAM
ncbi:hypothetical protein EV426DRAFT_574649 [Tirmania nivea]|nr:hypothetical protein EV426DRAFT_574649 [Tirmania nivea]